MFYTLTLKGNTSHFPQMISNSCLIVVVDFLSLWQNTWQKPFKGGKLILAQFQTFSSTLVERVWQSRAAHILSARKRTKEMLVLAFSSPLSFLLGSQLMRWCPYSGWMLPPSLLLFANTLIDHPQVGFPNHTGPSPHNQVDNQDSPSHYLPKIKILQYILNFTTYVGLKVYGVIYSNYHSIFKNDDPYFFKIIMWIF